MRVHHRLWEWSSHLSHWAEKLRDELFIRPQKLYKVAVHQLEKISCYLADYDLANVWREFEQAYNLPEALCLKIDFDVEKCLIQRFSY